MKNSVCTWKNASTSNKSPSRSSAPGPSGGSSTETWRGSRRSQRGRSFPPTRSSSPCRSRTLPLRRVTSAATRAWRFCQSGTYPWKYTSFFLFFFQSLSSILMGSLKFASCMNTCSGSWRFGLFTTFLIVVSCFEVTEVTGGSGQLLFCGSVTCNMSLLAASNVHLFCVCMWANANTSMSPQFIWLI